MRLGLEGNTPTLVSNATAARMGFDRSSTLTVKTQKNGSDNIRVTGSVVQPRLCVLSIREQGGNQLISAPDSFVIFKMNYKSLDWTQGARVQVQQGMNGYVINENGLSEPHFIIQGNGGSVLKSGNSAKQFEKGMVAIDQSFGTGSKERKYNIGGQKDPTAMDGQQFWFRLRAVCELYFNTNQARKASGKRAVEMVWFDPMHGRDGEPGLRWVVVPMAMPTLKRTAETQAVMPFHLDLAGVYDDIKGRQKPLTEPVILKPAATPKYKPPVADKITAPPVPKVTDPPSVPEDHPVGVAHYDTKEWKAEVDKIVDGFTPNNPFAPQVGNTVNANFDFRFCARSLQYIAERMKILGYPVSKHKKGSTDYYHGIGILASWVTDDADYHGEKAKLAAVAMAAASTINPVIQKWIMAFKRDVYNQAALNIKKGLTPWGGKK
jgi:hypothetical protein